MGGFPTGPAPGGFPGAPPQGVYAGTFPETSRAVLALVLSILGIFCCVTAPIGAVLGYMEKKGIDEGRRDPANRGQAIAALVIGGLLTGLFLAAILFFLVVGVASA
jgi:TRAP-type C4-dicarboxylate transport system permease small subunit